MICKRCGDEVLWRKTQNGKNILCEPGLVPFRTDWMSGTERVIDQDENMVKCRLHPAPEDISNVGWPVHIHRRG